MRKRIQRGAGGRSPDEGAVEAPRKKNYRLHQSTIDRAMEILGARTETETIEAALDRIVFQQEMLDAMDGMFGAGVVNVFDEEAGAQVRD